MLFFQNRGARSTGVKSANRQIIRLPLHSHQMIMIFKGARIITNNFTLFSSLSFSSLKMEDHLLYCSFDDRWSFCLALGAHENLNGAYETLFVFCGFYDLSKWPLGTRGVFRNDDNVSHLEISLRSGPFVPCIQICKVLLAPARPKLFHHVLHPSPALASVDIFWRETSGWRRVDSLLHCEKMIWRQRYRAQRIT